MTGRWLNDAPIKRKLTLLTMVTTSLALVLAFLAIEIYDQIALRRSLIAGLSGTAKMVGLNSASALSFNDVAAAEETLQSLAAQDHIAAACLYTANGRLFASYFRDRVKSARFPEKPPPAQASFVGDELWLVAGVTYGGETMGTIYLVSDLRDLHARLTRSTLVFVIVMFGAGLVAYFVASRLQRVISGPVSRLAEVAALVAEKKDYSIRVDKHGNDEVGALITGFNAMLAQIQSRDAALQEAHDELEQRVAERTRELVQEIAERRQTEHERDGFFTLSADLMCIASRTGVVRRANPAFDRMLGYSEEEMRRAGFMEFVHPEDKAQTAWVVKRLTAGRPARDFENRVRHRDGSYRWVAWSVTPSPGKEHFFACGRDVTALREAQSRIAHEKARLQFIFDSVPVGISLRVLNPDGSVRRMMNDAHLRICGLTREQATDPGVFERITHAEDFARQLELDARLIAGESKGYSLEKRYVHADGRVVWVIFSRERHRFADGSYEELSTIVDITALKNAQEHAAREHARFKFIFDSVPVGICLDHHAEGGVARLFNEAHLAICGLTREQAAQPGVFQRITHPDDLAKQIVLREQLEHGLIGRFALEKRYRRPDGQTVWVAYSVERRRTHDGAAIDLSTVVDITELKRAQEEVAQERARFKFIFDSVPVGIALMLPGESEARLVNPAHERLSGIPSADVTKPGAFERATHPEDFVRQRPLVAAFKRGEIDRFTLEKRYVHPNGRVVWVSLARRMFIDAKTGLKQAITTIVDITELKAAQEQIARERARFKFIFDTVPIGISWFVPGDEATHLVNPAHERITGVSAEESRVPGAFARVSHPEDYERQLALTPKFLRGEIDHYSIEKRYLHPEGRVVWAVLSSRMFVDPATGLRQSVTTLVDITERKETEARLAETHRQLLETSRAAGMAEVATGVLHNVGNVLNSVNVSATLLTDLVRESHVAKLAKLSELLAAQGADLPRFFASDPRAAKVPAFIATLAQHLQGEQREYLAELESLRKNIEHIKDIVAMQQSYAKVSGVVEHITVAELIEDALRMNEGALVRHGVTLVRDFQANPTLLIEKHKVLQILVNLMRNAKYACEESGRAEKRMTLRVVAEDSRVKIAVIDNGVGIPPENLTRIFSHGFTTRKHGHGFGLHSGALAARELGGSLIAQSEGAGCGAAFILELPLNGEAEVA